jgi:hypothetical protein
MGWRNLLKIHPACALFKPLPPDELAALGDDIRRNRLQERVKVIRDGEGYAVIDGQSRLDALELAVGPITVFESGGLRPNSRFFDLIELDGDPFDYVVSMNIRRRHLTGDQRRDLIAELLKRKPDQSDRQVAKQVGASPTTVGDVRADLEERGDVSILDTRRDAMGREQPAHRQPPEPPPHTDYPRHERVAPCPMPDMPLPAVQQPQARIEKLRMNLAEALGLIKDLSPRDLAADATKCDLLALAKLSLDARKLTAWYLELFGVVHVDGASKPGTDALAAEAIKVANKDLAARKTDKPTGKLTQADKILQAIAHHQRPESTRQRS